MKITVKQLRRIIRETLEEQTKFPGGAYGGGKLSDEDQERLAYQGFLGIHEEEIDSTKETEEVKEAKKKKQGKGLWANIHAKRKRGGRAARPGEKGYPKTLDIEGESSEIKTQ